jgi:hypothetical protein
MQSVDILPLRIAEVDLLQNCLNDYRTHTSFGRKFHHLEPNHTYVGIAI